MHAYGTKECACKYWTEQTHHTLEQKINPGKCIQNDNMHMIAQYTVLHTKAPQNPDKCNQEYETKIPQVV